MGSDSSPNPRVPAGFTDLSIEANFIIEGKEVKALLENSKGLARPGSKGVVLKTHEAQIVSWNGRVGRSFSENRGFPI
jgi:hypothetical protein